MNVQIEEIITPWFNYSETAQAIARGNRLGSHQMLLDKGIIPENNIYQRVSLPLSGDSIDLIMYQISEEKDIGIKKLERIFKETAVDCALTYNRNKKVGLDYTRECEYDNCEYECEGISRDLQDKPVKSLDLDYSTYQLYYNYPNIIKIQYKIEELLKIHFRLDFNFIKKSLSQYQYREFEILTALVSIIDRGFGYNKYGFLSRITDYDNNIFLTNNNWLSHPTPLFEYYIKFPLISISRNFNQNINTYVIPLVISDMFKSNNTDKIKKILSSLQPEVVGFIIENSFLAKSVGKNKNQISRDFILNYLGKFLIKIEGVLFSIYSYYSRNILRCLRNEKWVMCNNEEKEKFLLWDKENKKRFENSPYKYYGQFDPITENFCIKKIMKKKNDKKHVKTSGKVCNTWNKVELLKLLIFVFEIPLEKNDEYFEYIRNIIKKNKNIPDQIKSYIMTTNLRETLNSIDKIKEIVKYFTFVQKFLNKYNSQISEDIEKLQKLLYWATQTANEICEEIRDFLKKKNLVILDQGCGDSFKKKEI